MIFIFHEMLIDVRSRVTPRYNIYNNNILLLNTRYKGIYHAYTANVPLDKIKVTIHHTSAIQAIFILFYIVVLLWALRACVPSTYHIIRMYMVRHITRMEIDDDDEDIIVGEQTTTMKTPKRKVLENAFCLVYEILHTTI